jgi:hypothetical protein
VFRKITHTSYSPLSLRVRATRLRWRAVLLARCVMPLVGACCGRVRCVLAMILCAVRATDHSTFAIVVTELHRLQRHATEWNTTESMSRLANAFVQV